MSESKLPDWFLKEPDNGQLIRIGSESMKLTDLAPGDVFVVSRIFWEVVEIIALISEGVERVQLDLQRIDEDALPPENDPYAPPLEVVEEAEISLEEARARLMKHRAHQTTRKELIEGAVEKFTTEIGSDWP